MTAMTEEEAKTKWCPHARVALYVRGNAPELEKPVDMVGHGANRICVDDPKLNASIQLAIDGTGGTKCLGSACMVWRWASEYPVNRRFASAADLQATAEPERPATVPASYTWSPYDETEGDPPGWTEPQGEANTRARGFCGLAGSI